MTGTLLAAVSVAVSALIELAAPDRDLVKAFTLNVPVAMIGNTAGILGAGTMLESAGYPWAISLAGLVVAITCVVFAARHQRHTRARIATSLPDD